jgi:hypothetical protein
MAILRLKSAWKEWYSNEWIYLSLSSPPCTLKKSRKGTQREALLLRSQKPVEDAHRQLKLNSLAEETESYPLRST